MARNKSEKELRAKARRKKQRLRKFNILVDGRVVSTITASTASNY